jgi:phage replication O-like protein O
MAKQAGFTAFPNSLFDWILLESSNLTKRELVVMLAVIRNTVGYNRESSSLSLRYIQRATGINYTHVSSTVTSLVKKGYVTKDSTKRTNIIALCEPKAQQLPNQSLSTPQQLPNQSPLKGNSYQNSNSTVTESVTQQLPNRSLNSYRNSNQYKQTTENKNNNTNKQTEGLAEWLTG